MTDEIFKRIILEAEYILDRRATIREAADALGVSKSTLHTDVTTRLKRLDTELYQKVNELLKYNFSVRHIRGGEATRKKYGL